MEEVKKDSIKGEREIKDEKKVSEPKMKKWPVIVMAVIAILGTALGITMTILWLYERGKEPEIEVEEKTEYIDKIGETITITTESDGKHEREIKALLADLAERIPEWVDVRTSMGVEMPPRVMNVYNTGYPILYRPEELKISVVLNQTYGLMLDSNSYNDSVDLRTKYVNAFLSVVPDKIRGYLMAKGFSPLDDYGWGYISDEGIICDVGSSWPDPAVHCGYKDWYDAKVAAFSNEMALKAENFPEGMYLGFDPDNLGIKDSVYAPYQVMMGGLLSGVGLWYRVSPDADWQWFMGTQAVLECDEYNMDDLKKAFLGMVCMDENGEQSEVRL